MATYRVAFDGKWQGKFDDLADAVEWAQDVSETGRIVWVIHRRLLRPKLVAVFPEARAEEGRQRWEDRADHVGASFE